MHEKLVRFIREQYRTSGPVPLHAPTFGPRERELTLAAVESTFVSSVGAFVSDFESALAAYTGSPSAVAVVNGTAALHVALRLLQIGPGDLVLTQPLSFVATCNAIAYCGAEPVFIDVDRATLGLSASAAQAWLLEHAFIDDRGQCRTRKGGRPIKACLPMHTFGLPADLDGLVEVCERWRLHLVEDAAESLGSLYRGRHTGTFGTVGTLSFNGNKIVTTGGGGMLLIGTELGRRARHLTTTAKVPHSYEYYHDELAWNYRLPNLNAALGCAQLEQLESFVARKRALHERYAEHLRGGPLELVQEPENCRSNYWLNAVICESAEQRNALLTFTNAQGVMTRPIWTPMNRLPMFAHCLRGSLETADWLEARVVNVPSSVPPGAAP